MPIYNILLLGQSYVGKTTLLYQLKYLDIKNINATIGVDFSIFNTKIVDVTKIQEDKHKSNHEKYKSYFQNIKLQFWEIGEKYYFLIHQYSNKSSGIIIVYDLINHLTCKNTIKYIYDNSTIINKQKIPIFFIGYSKINSIPQYKISKKKISINNISNKLLFHYELYNSNPLIVTELMTDISQIIYNIKNNCIINNHINHYRICC